jgi:purine-binding chemotaxis protein CheW
MGGHSIAQLAATRELVVLNLADQRYALDVTVVERIVLAVAITRLPKAPQIVLGIVNVQGRVVPVVDTRQRFGLPSREIELSDHLVIARTSRRVIALLADAAAGVIRCAPDEITEADHILSSAEYLEGVVRLTDGLILIHDLDTFLSPVEEQSLDRALPA